MSLESTNPVRVWARPRSTPTTLSFSHEHCPSEDLDRRLESINHALRRDGLQPRKPNKRLHTSEVSRKEQSHTADDAVETGQSFRDYNCNKSGESSVKSTPRGILGALRNFQHKDSSRGMNDHSPSPAFSHTPSSYEAPSEMASQRSALEDRSNMAMQHSIMDRISKTFQSRRYGDFSFDSSPRRRRRNGRHSSVCMSSAESTPLFNALPPNEGQVLVGSQSQPSSWRSTIDPLATASLILATGELDRLANRPVSSRSTEVLSSGQSSACGVPPNSPAMKCLTSGEKSSLRMHTTSGASEMSLTPRNPLSAGTITRSGNSMPESAVHGNRRQRKTSSRFSEIRTPENILEASDEDMSTTNSPLDAVCTYPGLGPGSQSSHSSLASPPSLVEYSHMKGEASVTTAGSADQALEKTIVARNAPSKVSQSSASAKRSRPLGAVELDTPTHGSRGPRTHKSAAHTLHNGTLTPQNTRGLWCPPRKSLPPSRRQSMWSLGSPAGQSDA
ncbi:hypothetical protein N8I77_003127 [Diaporthe amygdali]|uniref:Uncharacterized protein n=1 Tax=Phomopsis amygdali TaxID=1214568 RepID=A0AAD9SJ99_PHOAM|nr:hypothetical protein N8I77_003127 [Diaporthe amygdali]